MATTTLRAALAPQPPCLRQLPGLSLVAWALTSSGQVALPHTGVFGCTANGWELAGAIAGRNAAGDNDSFRINRRTM